MGLETQRQRTRHGECGEGFGRRRSITNPALRVQTENGWFDMATPFFATEFTVDHLQLPTVLRGHIDFKYYDSGHMIYLNEQDLPKLKQNIADLIDAAIKPQPSAKESNANPAAHSPAP